MQPKGFLGALFDLEFESFVLPKIIRAVFILVCALIGLATLAVIGVGFSEGFMSGLLAMLLAPLVFIIYVTFVRISLESMIVVFRLLENTDVLVKAARKEHPDLDAPSHMQGNYGGPSQGGYNPNQGGYNPNQGGYNPNQ